VTDTLGSVFAEAGATLAGAGISEPRRRARQLLAVSLGISPTDLVIYPERALDRVETDRVRRLIGRMSRGEPLSRVLGRREFWGLDFALSDETLDPRPESETVVAAVLARVPNRDSSMTFLDMGTGTGCLLLALLSEFPAAAGFGIDISKEAAVTARRNAAALGLAARAHFLVGDWGRALAYPFDVIVANPPYIATPALAELPDQVSRYDPKRALNGGEDGLAAYRSIATQLAGLLAPSAIFVAEVGAGQARSVATILGRHGLSIEAIEHDLSAIERCVVARNVDRETGAGANGQKNLGMCRRHV
jgi:release factor glutamine methyltransferase